MIRFFGYHAKRRYSIYNEKTSDPINLFVIARVDDPCGRVMRRFRYGSE